MAADDSGARTVIGSPGSPGTPGEPAPAPARELPTGTLLGRYVLLAQIGAGGVGVVYSAYDPELDRKVAIKLLNPDSSLNADATMSPARLLREAQALAKLSHPNVIAVHDVGTFEGQIFVAMELVVGETLRVWLRRERRSLRAILDAFRAAGRGLHAAHDAGLVHRDFKPDNVLVADDGRVLVLDFGLARAQIGGRVEVARPAALRPRDDKALEPLVSRPLTESGLILGTPAYMAPEQHRGEKTDARGDIFSFCVALYEALYRQRPFGGDTLEELEASVLAGRVREPPPGSAVPAWVRRVLLAGMRTRPDERPASMAALVEELGRDPAAARRRAAVTAGVVVVAVAASLGVARLAQRGAAACADARDELAGVWDLGRKTDVRAAFAATGVPYAATAVAGVEKTLDDWAAAWARMHASACQATRVRHEQSEELYDLRMACLARSREDVRALVELFARADKDVVPQAAKAVAASTRIEGCANVAALRAVVPPPGPEAAAEADAIRALVARARALRLGGKLAAARAPTAEAMARASRLDYAPALAAALSEQGNLESDLGAAHDARRTLLDAVRAADLGRVDRARAEALNRLVYVTGYQLERHDDGLAFAPLAHAAILRSGGDDELLAMLIETQGFVLSNGGHTAEARPLVVTALRMKERLFGADSWQVALTLNALGELDRRMAHFDDAIPELRRALDVFGRTLGEGHPRMLLALNNLAVALAENGDPDGSLAMFERTLALRQAALGPDHIDVAMSHTNVGLVQANLKRFDEALEHVRRARQIYERALGPEHPKVAVTLWALADVLRKQGRLDEALAAVEGCLAIREKAFNAEHPLVAEALTLLGEIQLARGQAALAVAPLRRALAIEEHGSDALGAAAARLDLAHALAGSRGDPEEARRLAARAEREASALGPRGSEVVKDARAFADGHGRKP